MGFLRQQEEKMAVKLLVWQYQRLKMTLPERHILKKHASDLVDQAHNIAKERGKNVLSIIKELVNDIKKNMK